MRRTLRTYTSQADPQQGDPVLAEQFAQEQYDLGQAQNPEGEALEQNLGNTVAVPVPTGEGDAFQITNPQSLVFVTFKRPQATTFMVTADGPGTYVTINITVAGRARFTRTFPLPETDVPRNLTLYGRMIDISVGGVNNGAVVNVTGALVTESIDKLGELWATWVPSTEATEGVLSKIQLLVPTNAPAGQSQGGVLLGCQGFLKADDNSNYWIMFFDALTGPATGDQPLIAIGPLTSGETYSFDRSLREDIYFNEGLFYAISTTGDTFTPPGGFVVARVDFDWGT